MNPHGGRVPEVLLLAASRSIAGVPDEDNRLQTTSIETYVHPAYCCTGRKVEPIMAGPDYEQSQS
jgi:hypothetical protein